MLASILPAQVSTSAAVATHVYSVLFVSLLFVTIPQDGLSNVCMAFRLLKDGPTQEYCCFVAQ